MDDDLDPGNGVVAMERHELPTTPTFTISDSVYSQNITFSLFNVPVGTYYLYVVQAQADGEGNLLFVTDPPGNNDFTEKTLGELGNGNGDINIGFYGRFSEQDFIDTSGLQSDSDDNSEDDLPIAPDGGPNVQVEEGNVTNLSEVIYLYQHDQPA